MAILSNFLYQMLFSVGVIVAFGLLIALCRRAFCNIIGDNGAKILTITGVVGTPIHELSHALFCLIFGHKIEEMKLYQPNSDDGTMGYVNHSYNPRNFYHQIGNFFIAVGPIFGGSAVLLLLMRLMLPVTFEEFFSELQFAALLSTDFLDPSTYAGYLDLFWSLIGILFHFTNMGNFFWWLFMLLALSVASHMELSGADIKGGVQGLLFVAAAFLLMDTVLFFVSRSVLESVTAAITSFSITMAGFLAISAIFCGAMVVVALSYKGIAKLVKR